MRQIRETLYGVLHGPKTLRITGNGDHLEIAIEQIGNKVATALADKGVNPTLVKNIRNEISSLVDVDMFPEGKNTIVRYEIARGYKKTLSRIASQHA